ncbi:MAG: signal peptidase I [Alphaproteobacteria bacterium]|nr:signal peptidase I [Alphaproteobacteria bacterium]
MRNLKKAHLLSKILCTLGALLLALGIKIFLAELFYVSSGSMGPTLLSGDYVLVSKYAYGYNRHSLAWSSQWQGQWRVRPAVRGDIVVFHQEGALSPWIKRVIGGEGEEISWQGDHLAINGVSLQRLVQPFSPFYEEWLPGGKRYMTQHKTVKVSPKILDHRQKVVVPPHSYFVLGDARQESYDSRFSQVGMVDHGRLLGRAEWVLFSVVPAQESKAPWWQRVRWDRLFKKVM